MINNLDTEQPSSSPLSLEKKQAQVGRRTPEICFTSFFFLIAFQEGDFQNDTAQTLISSNILRAAGFHTFLHGFLEVSGH